MEERKTEVAPHQVSTLNYSVVNNTTLKFKQSKELSHKLKLGNSVFNYELGFKPTDFNNDEKNLQLKHVSKYEPASGKLENTESLKVGIP